MTAQTPAEQPSQLAAVPRCGARTRKGTPCQAPAVSGGERCRMHGGASPRGFAHPSTKSGAYSRHLRGSILKTYQDTIADPEILSLDAEIALLSGRLADLLEQISAGGPSHREVAAAWGNLQAAMRSKDGARYAAAHAELDRLISSGAGTAGLWREVETCAVRLAGLVRTETARRVAMNETLPIGKALEFARAILLSVSAHVPDPTIRGRIQQDVIRALGEGQVSADC